MDYQAKVVLKDRLRNLLITGSKICNYLTQVVLVPTFKNNQLDLIFTVDPNSIFAVEAKAPLGTYKFGIYDAMNKTFLEINWIKEFDQKNLNNCYKSLITTYESSCSTYIPLRKSNCSKNGN